MKQCTKCLNSKDGLSFYVRKNGRLFSECKVCTGNRKRQWARDNAVESAKIINKYREANPNKIRRQHLKYKYNLTLEQYATMYTQQDGKCKICSISLPTLVVDHDHLTMHVRGLLCGACNSVIGFAFDNPDTLRSAAKYLEDINTRDIPIGIIDVDSQEMNNV